MAASGIRMGKVFVEIGADPSKLFGALNRINKRLGRVGASMQNLGGRMAGMGVALAAPVALMSKHFASFDDAIRATAAVTGSLGSQGAAALAMMTAKARELGASTSFTAIEVANLMTTLGRAGFDPTQINAMTESVLALARATGTDATLSAGIVSATLRQFGLDASQAARVADVLTVAANSTFNTVGDLGEALKYAGPVAASLGMSLEDTVAALGALGNVGIQGSMAGTALKRLSVIAAGSGDELMALFGISNVDAAGNLKPLVQILDEINDATANMSVAERTEKMEKAFGLLGITAANALANSADGVSDLADRLREASGAAIQTAQAMDAGLGGSLRILLSVSEGVALAIGESLANSMKSLVDAVSLALGGIIKFVTKNESMIQVAAKAVAAFTLVGAAIFAIGTALSVASAALGVALNPLVLIPTLLAASLVGVVALDGGLGQLASTAATAFGGVFEAIRDGDLAGAMDILMAGLWAAWARGSEVFLNGLDDFSSAMYETLALAIVGIKAFWLGTVDNLFNGVMAALDAMVAAVRKSWNYVQSFITKGYDLEAENKKVDDEMSARARERDAAAPGIAGRMEQGAEEYNAAKEERDRTRQAAKDARRRNTQQAESAVTSKSRAAKDKRVMNEQFADLLDEIQAATTMEQLRDLYGQYEALSTTGRLTPAQDATLELALEDAQNRVTIGGGAAAGGANASPEAVKQSALDAAASQGETAGTFSSVGFGNMGFGGSLQQKANDLLGKIEQNTRDPGMVGA